MNRLFDWWQFRKHFKYIEFFVRENINDEWELGYKYCPVKLSLIGFSNKLLDLRLQGNLIKQSSEEERVSCSALKDNPVKIFWSFFGIILVDCDCALEQRATFIIFFAKLLAEFSFEMLWILRYFRIKFEVFINIKVLNDANNKDEKVRGFLQGFKECPLEQPVEVTLGSAALLF